MREMKKSIAAFWVILLTLVLSLSYAPEVSAAKKASPLGEAQLVEKRPDLEGTRQAAKFEERYI